MLLFFKLTKLKEKKKKEIEPPPVGPFVCKLHLADNGIDMYEDGADKSKSYQILHQTMNVLTRYLTLIRLNFS